MKQLVLLTALALELSAQVLVGTLRGRGADGTLTPIEGARLHWKGSQYGALTRSDGSFAIERPTAGHSFDTLIITAIGYRGDTVAVARTLPRFDHILEADYIVPPIQVEADAPSIAAAEPIRTELVTRRQLEQSACCTLAESFERSASVEVQLSDAVLGAKTIRLLGLRGIYTSGLIEAIPLLRGVTGAFALDDVPGPFLDCISISKGAASILSGYDGITGQINVEFKKPNRDVPFFGNLFANHLGRTELNLTSAQQLSPTLFSMVMLHGRMFQRDVDANGDGFMDMPRFGNLNGIARILWQEGDIEAQLVVRPTWGNYRSGTMGAWTNGVTGYRIETTTERAESYAKVAFNSPRSPLADRLGFQAAVSWQRLVMTAGDRRISAREHFAFAKLIAAVEPNASVKLLYGTSLLIDAPTERLDSLVRERSEVVPGIFAEATWTPSPALVATLGVRHDWHNLFGAQLTPRMHIKYSPTELITLRLSAGTGMRVPLMIAENAAAFLNNRQVLLDSAILPERAFNGGGGITATLLIAGRAVTFDGELYYTRFSRQLVIDFDRSARQLAIVYAPEGYATSALLQASTTLFPRFELTVAYRLLDTYAYTGGMLRLQPLVSPHRILIAASYMSADRVWEINPLLVWYSGGRIPTTDDNPVVYRFADHFPAYVRASLQVNYRPIGSPLEFYAGIENIPNVLQPVAVLAADNPRSSYFDASLVWGPLEQRTVYGGVRLRLGEPFQPECP
ncbi:MAG: TonB-dependent receptor [Bacteroidota bacterium]|nr:TonB-dependent receptor [Bacteroidota bacterium]